MGVQVGIQIVFGSMLLITLGLPLQGQTGRWEAAIGKFEQLDKEDPPQPAGVLFVGSSSIRMWKLEASFPDLAPLNRGFGGSQMSDVLNYVERIVIPYRPRVIVLYEGDNDIAKGKSPGQVVRDYQSLVERVHASLPRTRIVFLSIKPSIAQWKLYDSMSEANRRILKITEQDERQQFVDVSQVMLDDEGMPLQRLFLDDGLHLNEEGYRRWTNLVRPHLNPEAGGCGNRRQEDVTKLAK